MLLPLLPAVTVRKLALLLAVHVQPPWVETVTYPLPPLAEKETLVGEREYVQTVWVTVKVYPAMVSVPVREAALGFTATE